LIFNFTTLSQQWELNNITILWVSSYVPVNLGGLLLQALLEFWPRTHINPMEEEENELNHGRHFCKNIGEYFFSSE